MKRTIFALVLSLFFLQTLSAQESVDSTGLLGDNFSLQGALEIFKQSASPEDFEKKLNEEKTYVNNLDLNEDGDIDYIRVVDNMEDDVHALILQVAMSETESQDIAVIEIEKTGTESAILQIVGDEELYGKDMFVEPFEEETIETEGKGGPAAHFKTYRIVVNVWLWSPVRFMYGPRYRVWVSPWSWGAYPRYWRPWRPHPWRWHHSRRAHYHVHHRPVHVHRVTRAHRVYKPHRRTSVVVHKRSTTIKANKKRNGTVVKKKTTKTTVSGKNGKSVTRTKTTKAGVKKKNGKVKAGKKTTKTTTVKGKNKTGVKRTKTKTKAGKKGNKAGVKRTKTTTKAGKKGNKTGVKRTKTTTKKGKRRRN